MTEENFYQLIELLENKFGDNYAQNGEIFDYINSLNNELISIGQKLDYIYAALAMMFAIGLTILVIYILYRCIDKFITY